MPLDIVAPVTLVCLAIVIVGYTQVIAPKRNRRAVAAALGRLGWLSVGPGELPGWSAIERLAVERASGKTRDYEFDEKSGPFTFHSRRRERRSGRALAIYRDAGVTLARCAAVALHEEHTRTDGLAYHRRRSSTAREFWIGEARGLPVQAPVAVFRWTSELMREIAAPMARARGRNLEDIPAIASPPEDRLAQSVRAVLAETDLAREGRITLLVAPDAWVLTAPLDRSAARVDGLVALCADLSAVFDRWPPGR